MHSARPNQPRLHTTHLTYQYRPPLLCGFESHAPPHPRAVASAVAFVHDSRSRDGTLRAVLTPRFLFREEPNGAWTWLLQPEEKSNGAEEVGLLSGPVADFCRVLGCPVVRLRSAVPEEYLEGTVAGSLGRTVGISAVDLKQTQGAMEKKLKVAGQGVKSKRKFEKAVRSAMRMEAEMAAGGGGGGSAHNGGSGGHLAAGAPGGSSAALLPRVSVAGTGLPAVEAASALLQPSRSFGRSGARRVSMAPQHISSPHRLPRGSESDGAGAGGGGEGAARESIPPRSGAHHHAPRVSVGGQQLALLQAPAGAAALSIHPPQGRSRASVTFAPSPKLALPAASSGPAQFGFGGFRRTASMAGGGATAETAAAAGAATVTAPGSTAPAKYGALAAADRVLRATVSLRAPARASAVSPTPNVRRGSDERPQSTAEAAEAQHQARLQRRASVANATRSAPRSIAALRRRDSAAEPSEPAAAGAAEPTTTGGDTLGELVFHPKPPSAVRSRGHMTSPRVAADAAAAGATPGSGASPLRYRGSGTGNGDDGGGGEPRRQPSGSFGEGGGSFALRYHRTDGPPKGLPASSPLVAAARAARLDTPRGQNGNATPRPQDNGRAETAVPEPKPQQQPAAPRGAEPAAPSASSTEPSSAASAAAAAAGGEPEPRVLPRKSAAAAPHIISSPLQALRASKTAPRRVSVVAPPPPAASAAATADAGAAPPQALPPTSSSFRASAFASRSRPRRVSAMALGAAPALPPPPHQSHSAGGNNGTGGVLHPPPKAANLHPGALVIHRQSNGNGHHLSSHHHSSQRDLQLALLPAKQHHHHGEGGPAAAAAAAYSSALAAVAAAAPATSPDDATARLAVSALVLAYLYVARSLPGEDLAEIQRSTAEFFHGRTARGYSYDELVTRFRVMIGPGNLFTRARWLKRARCWRFVLLADPAGYWDATPGLAPALLAQRVTPKQMKHLQRKQAAGWKSIFMLAATEGEIEDAGDDVIGKLTQSEDQFCPVTGFDWTAVEWSVPEALKEVAKRYEAVSSSSGDVKGGGSHHHRNRSSRGSTTVNGTGTGARSSVDAEHSSEHHSQQLPPLNVLRLWTTILCVRAMRRLDESFLLKTSDRDGFEETIVDRAMEWLNAQARCGRIARSVTCRPCVCERSDSVSPLPCCFAALHNSDDLIAFVGGCCFLFRQRSQFDAYEALDKISMKLMDEANALLEAWETRHVRACGGGEATGCSCCWLEQQHAGCIAQALRLLWFLITPAACSVCNCCAGGCDQGDEAGGGAGGGGPQPPREAADTGPHRGYDLHSPRCGLAADSRGGICPLPHSGARDSRESLGAFSHARHPLTPRRTALSPSTRNPPTETFSAVLAPPTQPVMRWQRWLVIVTLILGVLTVDIWCALLAGACPHACEPTAAGGGGRERC